MVDAIEAQLATNMWLGGQGPSDEDNKKFTELAASNSLPKVDTHPNAFAWANLCSLFTEDVRKSWTAAAPEAAKGGKGVSQLTFQDVTLFIANLYSLTIGKGQSR